MVVVPNGVDLDRFQVTPVPAAARILFPGTLSYGPNVDGASWFCREVLPRVREAAPDVELDIVGRDAVPEVLELGRLPGVRVHSDVPSMGPHFSAARVVVVPLRLGTGTRLKALEALAASRPLVGTSIGLEGLGLVDGVHARVADGPGEMTSAILELLGDRAVAQGLAVAGRELVEDRFGWDRVGKDFVDAMTAEVRRSS